jgi:hypothetical protein
MWVNAMKLLYKDSHIDWTRPFFAQVCHATNGNLQNALGTVKGSSWKDARCPRPALIMNHYITASQC